jgi:hypothetical protein
VDALLNKLAAHRRRIRGARVADAALRWGFYASIAACLGLLIAKLAGIALPVAVLAAVPAAMALRELTRRFSIRDCAIHLDRELGLEERLSTALEASGAVGQVLGADATEALARAPRPARGLPREGKLLAGSLVILAVLATIPSPGRAGAKGDPAFEALTAAEAEKLLALAKTDVRFEEAAEALKQGRAEEAIAILEELKRKLMEKALSGGSGAETQAVLDQATSSAAAISAELARLGRAIHAPPPAVAQAKLERQRIVEQGNSVGASPVAAARAVHADDAPWNPRYDPVIRRYFGREP